VYMMHAFKYFSNSFVCVGICSIAIYTVPRGCIYVHKLFVYK
jgi:hypothetical protein